jgi:hypothetical protein
MSIEKAFLPLFSERVTLFPSSSIDKYGKRSFSASASVSACAHYVAETVLTRDAEGRDVIETGRYYLYGVVAVTTDSKIRLQDGTEPVIVGVDTPHDWNGQHHTVVRVNG